MEAKQFLHRHKFSAPLILILLGFFASLAIATLQVYLANVDLQGNLQLLREAGYLVVPNQKVQSGLDNLSPAFWSGILLSSSIGTGVIVISLFLVLIGNKCYGSSRMFLFLFFVIWGCLLGYINQSGFCPIFSAYFLLVPAVVLFFSLVIPMPGTKCKSNKYLNLLHLILILLLILLYSENFNKELFLKVRDNLLLATPVGVSLNEFYYKHTLYAANVLKPLKHKISKTCSITGNLGTPQRRSLQKTLLRHDYFCVSENEPGQLTIAANNQNLIFKNRHDPALKTTFREFSKNPGKILNRFSRETDKYSAARTFTFVSLLVFLPVFLYTCIYLLIGCACNLILSGNTSQICAMGVCFCTGLLLLLPLKGHHSHLAKDKHLQDVLSSNRTPQKIAALRFVSRSNKNILKFDNYQDLRKSSSIAVRYWLVQSLGNSEGKQAASELHKFLDDSSPIVVCQAIEALGKIRGREIITELKDIITESEHWYVQWYAYTTLKDLGWRPKTP